MTVAVRIGRGITMLLAGLVACVSMTAAAGGGGTFYTGTGMSFGYGGAIDGTFDAEGSVLDVSGFPPEIGEATVGLVTDRGDSTIFVVTAAIKNVDETFDWVVAVLGVEGELAPGTYTIGNAVVVIALFDDAEDVVLVEDDQIPIQIVAANRFLGSGTVTIDTVGETMTGSFSGILTDPENILRIFQISDGEFDLSGPVVPIEETSWGRLKAVF